MRRPRPTRVVEPKARGEVGGGGGRNETKQPKAIS